MSENLPESSAKKDPGLPESAASAASAAAGLSPDATTESAHGVNQNSSSASAADHAHAASTAGDAAHGPSKNPLHKIKALLKNFKSVFSKLHPRSLKDGLKNTAQQIFRAVLELPFVFFRSGIWTKLLFLAFFASLWAFKWSGSKLLSHYAANSRSAQTLHSDGDHSIEKDAAHKAGELHLDPEYLVFMEAYRVPVRSKQGNSQMLDIEVFLEVSHPELKAYLKAHLEELKDWINTALVSSIEKVSFEELLTVAGKERLKSEIISSLNLKIKKFEALPLFSGKTPSVNRVFFSRFMMSG